MQGSRRGLTVYDRLKPTIDHAKEHMAKCDRRGEFIRGCFSTRHPILNSSFSGDHRHGAQYRNRTPSIVWGLDNCISCCHKWETGKLHIFSGVQCCSIDSCIMYFQTSIAISCLGTSMPFFDDRRVRNQHIPSRWSFYDGGGISRPRPRFERAREVPYPM
jgi:hypothetical protein